MLAHVLNAGVRALAASLFFGGVLIYAVGGIDSPAARLLAGVITVSFFMFWIVFVFLFGPRVPKSGRQREQGERGDRDGDTGDSGGGDSGGD